MLGGVRRGGGGAFQTVALATGNHEIRCVGRPTLCKGLHMVQNNSEVIEKWSVSTTPSRMKVGHHVTFRSNEVLQHIQRWRKHDWAPAPMA